MSDFEDIQRLIRLKQYESPPKDFVDQFMDEFQYRQRSELLRQSAHGLLLERLRMYFDELATPKWALAAAALVIAAIAVWMLVPESRSVGGSSGVTEAKAEGGGDFAIETVRIMVADDPDEDPGLLSEHFEGYEELLVMPTGHGTGIAVPVKHINRVEEKAEQK